MARQKKPAQSFRLGNRHREKLEEIATFQDESQVEILRRMIDVAYKAMKKRREARAAARAAAEAEVAA